MQDFQRYLSVLHKRRALLVTCLAVSLAVATVVNYTTRPTYMATAQILIAGDTPNILPNKEIVQQAAVEGSFQTQLQLLRGRMLAERVVERLGLQKHPEFQTGPLLSPWERVQVKLFGRPPVVLEGDGIPITPAGLAFISRLRVEPVGNTKLVNLRFIAYDPKVAADAVNGLAQLYIEQSMEFRYTASSEATAWLSERLTDQQKKVEAASRALSEYLQKNGLTSSEGRQGLEDQKMAGAAAATAQARTERLNKEALYRQLSAMSQGQLEASPQVMGSATIQGLRGKLADQRKELSRLADSLGEKHPDMVRLRAEIRATEEKLDAEVQNLVRLAEAEYRLALQQESALQATLDEGRQAALELDRKGTELDMLKREVASTQQIYQELLGRSKQSGLESELKTTSIRIVDKALPPNAPFSPQRMRNYQMALLVGLAFGVGLVLLFEHLDNTLRTPDDVKDLGLPFLGMVPRVDAEAPGRSPRALGNPQSSVAESYRVLRTNLIFSAPAGEGRVVLVTSPSPGEGKTTTAANLAAALALNGARVLVIDADLRRPTLHTHLGVSKTPGLSDLTVGKCQSSEAVQATPRKGLHVLPCGYTSPNPAELLGSGKMREIIEAFRTGYDWVLIDTPPVLAMADTSVLCPWADGVILVIAAEATIRTSVQRAVEQIVAVGGKVLGVVLNKVDLRANSYYYSQYYGEYYRSYYGEGEKAPTGAARPTPGAGSGRIAPRR